MSTLGPTILSQLQADGVCLDVLAATKLTLERAAKNIDQAEVRSRQMARKLKSVEALPSEAAQMLLGKEPEQLLDEEL